MPTPFLTTVADTLFAPDGSLVNGSMSVTNPQTFSSADGYTILLGTVVEVLVTNGIFSVNLVPNEGSTPASTYTVKIEATAQFFTLIFDVPHSMTPVKLPAVVQE